MRRTHAALEAPASARRARGRGLRRSSRRRSRRRGAAPEVRVAIMTDCKGAFGFGYEPDIGGAQAAFAQYAGGKAEEQEEAVGRA